MKQYILVNKMPVLEPDGLAFLTWFNDFRNRIVQQDFISGVRISTVFLGYDHDFFHTGDPILFETMIFSPGSKYDEYQRRSKTWDEALKEHEKAIDLVKQDFS